MATELFATEERKEIADLHCQVDVSIHKWLIFAASDGYEISDARRDSLGD